MTLRSSAETSIFKCDSINCACVEVVKTGSGRPKGWNRLILETGGSGDLCPMCTSKIGIIRAGTYDRT